MKIMFTVQGDGRGHMTQAIAAAQTLENYGHELVAVTIGTNPSRSIPEFFCQAFGDRLIRIESPGFSFRGRRSVATLPTLRQALSGLGDYRKSLAILSRTIERTQPDLLINFLEPLTGLFNLVRPHRIPVVSVGHHFMVGHPDFVRSQRFWLQQWMMRQYVNLAGARSTKLALSFYPATSMPERRLVVCPPLLRREVFDLPQDLPGRFLLAYVLNQGYAADILRWHAVYPDVELHCFCEKPKVEPVWRYDSTLFFHKLDGVKFLRMMAESRGVACTAGFESLNEAAWLGKRLLVVPVENHVEQYFNALDAEKAGLALAASRFDLTPLLRRRKIASLDAYRTWVRRANAIFLSVIEEATRRAVRRILPAYSPAVPESLSAQPKAAATPVV
jgi:uncharacterized protein (TIGR00661 family)